MTSKSILEITDCIDPIDLLNIKDGFLVCDWKPAIAPWKDGGSWQSSPLADGKRLASKSYDNAVETFELKISGSSQDAVIAYIQSLITMLEKAVQYWTTNWQRQPVWIKARGATESNPRYAVIKAYTIDGLSNPYSQPFFGNCKSAMDKFTLVIERDHWIDQFPGTGVCVELNTRQAFQDSAYTNGTFTSASPFDTIAFVSPSTIGFAPGRVGAQSPSSYLENTLRFPNVTIPKGSTIIDAYVTLIEEASIDNDDLSGIIYGELTPNAPLFTGSVPGYMARRNNPTESNAPFYSAANSWGNPGGSQVISGLAGIIQEIVDQYEWVSGNALALFLRPVLLQYPYDTNYRGFGTVATGSAPVLTVVYTAPISPLDVAGRASTCTGNVYVSNKHNTAQLTHIFVDGAGTNLLTQPLPLTLLASPPVLGSEVFFGIASDTGSAGPFDSLALNLSIASVNTPLTWYYADTAAPTWAELEASSDQSTDMAVAGESIIIFVQPSDWVECTINGVPGWWIKATVGTPTGATTAPVQQTRDLYTVVTPFVDIDGSTIVGELPALARIRLYGEETNRDVPTCVIAGLRSKSRGENFSPYLNFSPKQNPFGVAVSYPAYLIADSSAPTGYKLVLSITQEVDDWTTTRGKITLGFQIANEYIGSFHAYCRYAVPTGDDDDFNMRLAYSLHSTGPWNYTNPLSLPYTYLNICVADFGIIELGGTSLAYGEKINNIYFEVEYLHTVDTNSILWLYDLILIPTDEWAGLYRTPTNDYTGVLGGISILDIDPIGSPRSPRALLRSRNGGELLLEDYQSEWIKMTRGGPFLQINSDQRLWFTALNIAENGMMRAFMMQKMMVKIYKAQRYLTMRGAI